MPLNPETLKAMKKACAKATPGSWAVEVYEHENWKTHENELAGSVIGPQRIADPECAPLCADDARFIAVCNPANVSALIAEVERQAREIERLKLGNFTANEFQGLCHNRSVQDGFEAFADGCETYQRQLFGRCRKGVAE